MPGGTEGHVQALGRGFAKLKTGRWRAVTLFEETPLGVAVQDPDLGFAGVVWLGAVGFRKDGDPDDAYEVFARLGPDAIEPTELDYTDLFADIHTEASESLRRDLEAGVAALLDKARAEPDVLHRLEIEPGLGIAVRAFAHHGYRILVLPARDARGHAVSEELWVLFGRIVFPGVDLGSLEYPSPALVRDIAEYEVGASEFSLSFRYKTA